MSFVILSIGLGLFCYVLWRIVDRLATLLVDELF